MATFGERLHYLRKAKGLSQKELAKLLNLGSSSTISQYETLNRIPGAQVLQKMADLFECSLDYLLARTNGQEKPGSPNPDVELAHIINELGPEMISLLFDLKGMTDEEKRDLKIFLQVLKMRREQEKGK